MHSRVGREDDGLPLQEEVFSQMVRAGAGHLVPGGDAPALSDGALGRVLPRALPGTDRDAVKSILTAGSIHWLLINILVWPGSLTWTGVRET